MSDLVHVTLPSLDAVVRPADADIHLRVCLDDAAATALRAHADVLYFARIVPAEVVAAQLAAFPGCLVCAGPAADGTVVLAVRGGRWEGISPLLASAVHALLASGLCCGRAPA
jgi:hypothetical protein